VLWDLDDCAVDGSHVRALKGGEHVGPSPVDRARPGSKHHLIVDHHGTGTLRFRLHFTERSGRHANVTICVTETGREP